MNGAAVVRRADENPDEIDEGLDRTEWMGSLNGLVRWTTNWFSTYAGAVTAFGSLTDSKDSVQLTAMGGVAARLVTTIGETHYRGVALRLDGSRVEDVSTQLPSGEVRNPFLTLRPLDEMQFGSGTHIQGIFELRYELMGCYAPFVHLTGGARGSWNDAEKHLTVPLSINAGAHREIGGDPLMVYGGFDLDLVDPQDGPEFLPRLRFGVETLNLFGETGIRLGFLAEIVLGDVDGTYAGLTVALPLTGDGPP